MMPNEPITTKIITHKLTPWHIQNCDLYTPFSGSAIELAILTGRGYHAEIRQRLRRAESRTDPARSMDIVITEKRWKGENVSTIEVSNTISEENEWLNETNCYGVKIPWAEGACGALGITLDSGATTLTGIQTESTNWK